MEDTGFKVLLAQLPTYAQPSDVDEPPTKRGPVLGLKGRMFGFLRASAPLATVKFLLHAVLLACLTPLSKV